MKKIVAALLLCATLAAGAVVSAEDKPAPSWPCNPTELYVMRKLGEDGQKLLANEAAVRAERKAHEEHLAAFIADTVRVKAIDLPPRKTLGLSADGKAFVLVDDPSAPPIPAGPAPVVSAAADVAPSKSAP